MPKRFLSNLTDQIRSAQRSAVPDFNCLSSFPGLTLLITHVRKCQINLQKRRGDWAFSAKFYISHSHMSLALHLCDIPRP